jgi:hypothetical protein
MAAEIRVLAGTIEGEFEGFEEGSVFRLDTGRMFQQTSQQYLYHYAFRPGVRISSEGGSFLLEVQGIKGKVVVNEVSIVEEGTIASEFSGFDGSSKFTFDNGNVWQQAEYKYEYHYAYRPEAIIFDGANGPELRVEGMNETVRVKRIR